jgi:prepilin-type processing-associated H-X9-DG protein
VTQLPDVHPPDNRTAIDAATGTSYKSWHIVTAIKQSEVDVKRSMVTDLMHQTNDIPHQQKSIAGMNAGFPDGHVAWQGARAVPQAFDATAWKDLPTSGKTDAFRAIVSWFKP